MSQLHTFLFGLFGFTLGFLVEFLLLFFFLARAAEVALVYLGIFVPFVSVYV